MARKKILYVIVEGMSDEEALGAILSKIFTTNTVYVHIMRFDVTTVKGNNPSNIIAKVCESINQYAKDNHFTKSHFQEIIHLVDTDGAYIPSTSVVEDLMLSNHIYLLDTIRTPKKEAIIKRNAQKSANLNKIHSYSSIWGLPYSIYYMSCNLDRVFYNKQNSSDSEKENDSFQFAKKYHTDINGFLSFISASDFSVCGDYKQSWLHIKMDTNSLKRYSNFGLCFKEREMK